MTNSNGTKSKKKRFVYIITSGEYSGYGINCVFLSRKAAENWLAPIEANNEARRILGQSIWSDDYEIEEWEVGCDPKKLRAVWTIEFDRNGNVLRGYLNDLDREPLDDVRERAAIDIFNLRGATHSCTVEAKNQETAIKIASEMHAQYLARKAGIA